MIDRPPPTLLLLLCPPPDPALCAFSCFRVFVPFAPAPLPPLLPSRTPAVKRPAATPAAAAPVYRGAAPAPFFACSRPPLPLPPSRVARPRSPRCPRRQPIRPCNPLFFAAAPTHAAPRLYGPIRYDPTHPHHSRRTALPRLCTHSPPPDLSCPRTIRVPLLSSIVCGLVATRADLLERGERRVGVMGGQHSARQGDG